ncbi:MAG: hypothetical protein HXX08_16935 [Chloroflexi bacterium]|uniref:DUF5666 domain-containing protein n=1 Tax=Candidatus Chlorohelix allophototropha TaxID=3003348 RepID=A0A8T7M671_9CHLR|nr:hypothetical protein [Chloroflexota bacterium]WJW69457.1 hypothetical protein OZ401_003070 [Chloroflexota bacterium L227-S17]
MSIGSMVFRKKSFVGLMFLLLLTIALVACGDAPTSTPVPANNATTAAVSGNNNLSPAGQTPGAGFRQGNFNPSISGTVDSYDATAKTLTVKAADGTIQKFDVSNVRLTKTDKISLDELTKLAVANETIQVTGDKASDGSYNATQLTVLDPNAVGGNGGAAGRLQRPVGTGTPGNNVPNNGNGTPNGTFGNGSQRAGFPGIVVQNAVVSGNKLTGTDFAGQAITVNLSATTTVLKRAAGTTDELKAGVTVSVNYVTSQSSTITAVAIVIE